jgi:hypothetical protein
MSTAAGGSSSLEDCKASFKHMRLFAFNNYGSSFRMAVAELKFFDESGGRIATPCTTGPASCTASSEYNSNYLASKAFDGSTSSYWATAGGAVTDQWLQISFQQPVAISRFSITPAPGSYESARPKDFRLQGSNVASPSPDKDSSDWITLRAVTGTGDPESTAEETFQSGWCEAGYERDGINSPSCIPCAAGTYKTAAGIADCADCPRDYWLKDDATMCRQFVDSPVQPTRLTDLKQQIVRVTGVAFDIYSVDDPEEERWGPSPEFLAATTNVTVGDEPCDPLLWRKRDKVLCVLSADAAARLVVASSGQANVTISRQGSRTSALEQRFQRQALRMQSSRDGKELQHQRHASHERQQRRQQHQQ